MQSADAHALEGWRPGRGLQSEVATTTEPDEWRGADTDSDDDDNEDLGSGAQDDEEREAAAIVIQQTWRSCRFDVADLDLSNTGEATAQAACCIVCFAFIQKPSAASDSAAGDEDEVSVCAECAQRMTFSSASATPGATRSGCADPAVPSRLSHLLRVEAKVNDQLQLLRDQHRILLAQQEQLQATKRLQAEQEAAARALARQRRRHVRMLLERRKREEEEKFRQFMTPELGSDGERSSTTPSMSAKKRVKKKPRDSTAAMSAESAPSECSLSVDAPTTCLPTTPSSQAEKKADKRVANMQSEIQEHTRQLWQRRKQTLDCYSQDLAPLVNGSKPKRLPAPAGLLAHANNHASKTSKKPSSSTKSSSGPWTASPTVGQTGNQQSKVRRSKKAAVKLRPLANRARTNVKNATAAADLSNNQLDELDPSFYRSAINSSLSPLTAEIKPVSWIYELGKDLIAGETEEEGADMNLPRGSLAGLSSVMEEGANYSDEDDRESTLAPFRRLNEAASSASSLFPPLVRQLPAPVAVSPLPTVSVQGGAPAQQAARGWEYSSERLAGLLEKYNVTVKEATATADRKP